MHEVASGWGSTKKKLWAVVVPFAHTPQIVQKCINIQILRLLHCRNVSNKIQRFDSVEIINFRTVNVCDVSHNLAAF